MNDDELLTLEEATAIARYKSVKTLRRAYARGDLAVVQPVPGGQIKVWRSELMRWLCTRDTTPTSPERDGSPERRATRGAPTRGTVGRKPGGTRGMHTGRPDFPASRPKPKGAPPRLSLADVKAP